MYARGSVFQTLCWIGRVFPIWGADIPLPAAMFGDSCEAFNEAAIFHPGGVLCSVRSEWS